MNIKRKKEKSNPLHDLFDILEIFVICTSCIVLIFSLVVRMTVVDGSSMENTLMNQEYLLVNDFSYTPKRGDIVVVNDPSKPSIYSKPLVKRVIGIAGDTIEIKNGVLYLNGEVQDEEYIKEPMNLSGSYALTIVPEHHVYIMGDNRNASGDSRTFGPVDERCIVGKAFMRVFPFGKIKFIQNPVG